MPIRSRPVLHKGLDDRFDDLKAIRTFARPVIVFGQHAARKIDRQHDVITLLMNLALVVHPLRARQRKNQQGQPRHAHAHRQPRKRCHRRTIPGRGKRHDEGRDAAPSPQPCHQRNHRQRQQPPRIMQRMVVVGHFRNSKGQKPNAKAPNPKRQIPRKSEPPIRRFHGNTRDTTATVC